MQRLRAEHDVDVGRAPYDGGAFLRRDAAADADDDVGVRELQFAHAAEIVEDAFLRVFAHGARVEQDHVGILGPVRARESFGRVQHVGHLVRVVLVHLAAERADEKLFRHGVVCHCAAPGREVNPWESSQLVKGREL